MPYIMITMWCPDGKESEAAQKYLEVIEKYPPDENLGSFVVPAALRTTEQGPIGISIWEANKGKLEESYTRITKSMLMFRSISGIKYTMDIYYTLKEGLKSVGMSLSE